MTGTATPATNRHLVLDQVDKTALLASVLVFAAGLTAGTVWGVGAGLPVRPQLYGTPGEFGAIAARNIAVCAALILAAHLRVLRLRWASNAIDVLAAVVLLPTTLLVALIASHPGGARYLPHAPLELTAVAISGAWWWRHHNDPPSPDDSCRRLALVTALLLLAAALETFAVPHRHRAALERGAERQLATDLTGRGCAGGIGLGGPAALVVGCASLELSQRTRAGAAGPTPVGPSAATGKPCGCRAARPDPEPRRSARCHTRPPTASQTMTTDPTPTPPRLAEILARAERAALQRRQTPGAASHFAAWQLRTIGQRHPDKPSDTAALFARWHLGYHGPLEMAKALEAFQHAWCEGLCPDTDDYLLMTQVADREALLDHLSAWIGYDAPSVIPQPDELAEMKENPLVQRLLELEDAWWDLNKPDAEDDSDD